MIETDFRRMREVQSGSPAVKPSSHSQPFRLPPEGRGQRIALLFEIGRRGHAANKPLINLKKVEEMTLAGLS